MIRRWLRRATALAVALLVVYGALLAWVVFVSREDQQRSADAIVVLGAAHYNGRPSPVLLGRLEHALTLYHGRLAPWIVVTGGTHPGDAESEASVQRRYLLEHAVPDSVVVPLEEGATTQETMAAVARWLRAERLDTVLLVSDGFHLARLRLEARNNGVIGFTTPTPESPIARGSYREWTFLSREALKVPVAWLRRFP